MRITASAPGKLVLSGEYAVLDGAPAICVAVDRRAVVTVESHVGDHHIVLAPGFTTATGRFRADEGGLTWLSGGGDFGLFEAVWNASRPGDSAGPIAVSLDTGAFRDPASGSKIGLGSSAALAAALAVALESMGGACARSAAHAGHRHFQGGSGSGVDVACSIAGGIIEYRMPDRQSKCLQWPRGMHCSVLWSGIAAGTRGRLARFGRQPDSRTRSELREASSAVTAALAGGRATAVLEAIGQYTRALLRFDAAHGLGIFDAGYASLAGHPASGGVVYKPCGAGGGDIGVALATSRASLASFEQMAARSGFTRLALGIDPRGAMLHDKDEL
jgi:phosphomevalonate kinase